MDNQLLKQIAWTSYEMNKAIKQIKFDLSAAGWDYVDVLNLSDGISFMFRRKSDGLQTVIHKADIADAVTWDYFDVWWDDAYKGIIKMQHKQRR